MSPQSRNLSKKPLVLDPPHSRIAIESPIQHQKLLNIRLPHHFVASVANIHIIHIYIYAYTYVFKEGIPGSYIRPLGLWVRPGVAQAPGRRRRRWPRRHRRRRSRRDILCMKFSEYSKGFPMGP